MKLDFKRKKSAVLIKQALVAMAFGMCVTAQAQTTVHVNRPVYFNLLDPQTTSSLIQILQVHNVSTIQRIVGNPVIVAAHRGVVDKDHAENTSRAAVNTMNSGIESGLAPFPRHFSTSPRAQPPVISP
jgi:hypothetical protein